MNTQKTVLKIFLVYRQSSPYNHSSEAPFELLFNCSLESVSSLFSFFRNLYSSVDFET